MKKENKAWFVLGTRS